MTWRRWFFVFAALSWLASGTFLVPAEQIAVLQSCGRVVRDASGAVRLYPDGVHWDWPWPLTQVDRVRTRDTQFVSIGSSVASDVTAATESDFHGIPVLRPQPPSILTPSSADEYAYVTADRNLRDIGITLNYRPNSEALDDYLAAGESRDVLLRAMLEAIAAEAVLQTAMSELDQPIHRALEQRLMGRLEGQVQAQRLGIKVEYLSLRASPPTRVRAAHLQEAMARADRQRMIEVEQANAIQRTENARGQAGELERTARAESTQIVGTATARSDRIKRLLAAMESRSAVVSKTSSRRQHMMQRMYLETVEEVLANVGSRLFVDPDKPTDVTTVVPRATP